MKQLFWVSLFLFSLNGFGAVTAVTKWVLDEGTPRLGEKGHQESTQPVVIGDLIFSANHSGKVHALDRKHGYTRWDFQMPSGVDGALSYGRSLVFVGDIHGNLAALRSRDGSLDWMIKRESEWLTPPAAHRNLLYATTASGNLFAFNIRKNGEEVWQYARAGDEKITIRGGASPVIFGNEVYQGFSDGYFVALNARTGSVIWSKKLRTQPRFYDVDLSPYVDEERVIVASSDGTLYCLDRLSGDTKWVFKVGARGGVHVEGNKVFFAGLNKNFYALDKRHGTVLWKTPFSKGVGQQPVRSGDYLVFTTSDDPVYLLKPSTGKIAWTGNLGAGTLAAAGGHLDGWFYVLSNFGKLFAYELVSRKYPERKLPPTIASPSAFNLQP